MGQACTKSPDAAPPGEPEETVPPVAGEPEAQPVSLKPFPTQWGSPPEEQTSDIVEWPGGYGSGSSTTAKWIQENLDADEKAWRKAQEAVDAWEVKEILRFLECAERQYGLDDNKPDLVKQVKEVQADVLNRMLDTVQKPETQEEQYKAWESVINDFLCSCLDSVNSMPPGRDHTFIHVAAHQGDPKILSQLTKLSADIFLKSASGLTAKEIAHENGQEEAEQFLQSLEERYKVTDDKEKKKEFAETGCETLIPRVFNRTQDTMFLYEDDSSFVAFSKIGLEHGWDASAISFEPGVTKIIMKFDRRGTTKESGLADTRKRPLIFGLTDSSDDKPVASGCAPKGQGAWVMCETAELDKRNKPTIPPGFGHELADVSPADIITMEVASPTTIKIKIERKTKNHNEIVREAEITNKKPWGNKLYAKILMYDVSDCVSVCTGPFISMPVSLRRVIACQAQDYRTLLKVIVRKLLPDWLREEIDKNKDPTDENGHMMYIASLIVMLTTRAWMKEEAQAMDRQIRSNYAIPFNHDWAHDLGKVLKKIWNNGGVPKLSNLRASAHARIPGSCKNKAVLALVLVDEMKPKHQWRAWTVWRSRNQTEAEGRFPNKKDSPSTMCYCQLHCVNAHKTTNRWFDVIRFWDRDPLHRWPVRYPDPDLVNEPNPSNFDLTAHTEWLRDKAGPGGTFGYGCPKEVSGTVPLKLYALGVQGEHVAGEDDDEEEEEDSWEDMC